LEVPRESRAGLELKMNRDACGVEELTVVQEGITRAK
jgi:hypothetical protein